MPEGKNNFWEPIEKDKKELSIEKNESPEESKILNENEVESLDEKRESALKKQEFFDNEERLVDLPESQKDSLPVDSLDSEKDNKKGVEGIKKIDHQNQIKKLCEIAFEKGLNFAIEEAKNLDNAYVLDEFHDTLVDELKEKLIHEGKLEEIK